MTRFRSLPLVTQLIVLTLLLGAAAGLAGAWLLRASARDAIREEVAARNVGIAQRLATAVDDRIRANIELLGLLAANEKVTTLRPGAQSELFVALRSPSLSDVTLFDGSGRIVAAAAEDHLVRGDDSRLRPEVVASVRAQSFWVRVISGEQPRIEIAVPVEAPPGSVIGALLLDLAIEDVASLVEARSIQPGAIAFLIGGDGRVLVHPERGRVVRQERFDPDAILSNPSRSATLMRGGRDVLASGARTMMFNGAIIVEEPLGVALAGANETAAQLTLILLLSVLAIVAGVSLLGRSLLHPLRDLQSSVDAFGRGELDQRARETGGREVKALAADFNIMAGALESKIDELATSEQRLHAILDNSTAIVYLKDLDGRYLFVNRQFQIRFDKNREQVYGHTDADVFDPEMAAIQRATDVSAIEQRTVVEREEAIEQDGEAHIYLSVKFPLFAATGEPYAVCCISTDISERKKLDAYQRQLEDARRRRRQALEINDHVIQGVAVALYSLDLRRPAEAQKALEETLAAARSIINDLMEDAPEDWGPGDLTRSSN